MKAVDILIMAKTATKRSYYIYNSFKNSLTEELTCEEYERFISELCKILRV